MQRSRRMDTIVWVAAQTEREAAERLIRNRRDLDDLTQKLQQFRSNRHEYVRQLASGAAMSAAQMRELRRFVVKLDGVIRHLEQQVTLKSKLNVQHQEEWIGQKRRTEALSDIAGRYRDEEARALESRVQIDIDDRRAPRDPR